MTWLKVFSSSLQRKLMSLTKATILHTASHASQAAKPLRQNHWYAQILPSIVPRDNSNPREILASFVPYGKKSPENVMWEYFVYRREQFLKVVGAD
jgi:hypothetical protein